ncbi:MAG: ferritin [Synergistes sp.]|nr:ferritin [Synergistes sp.]
MVIDKNMEAALNKQILAELESAYLYLSMATWFDANDLPGGAHWMKKQFAEEQEHAMKIYEYVADRGGHVVLGAMAAPKNEWNSPQEVFEETLAHEQKVTALINGLVEQALAAKDFATNEMLLWFVNEQVEEEKDAMAIVAKYHSMGNNPISIAMIDKELAAR